MLFSLNHTIFPSKSTIILFDLSKNFSIAFILDKESLGASKLLRSLNFGYGFTSLIVFTKKTTSSSVNSFKASSLLFLFLDFFLIF